MKILLPVHYFSDDPQSGFNTELWNFPSQLAKKGYEVFIVTTASHLVHETKKSLAEKNIYLYQIYNFKNHGLGYTEALMTFLFSVWLRLFHKFDWIFVLDAAKTPFSRFKLGAKLAGRIFIPETPEMLEFFNSGDWKYDRSHKDESEGIDTARAPFIYRCFRFLAYRIWYKVFPIKNIAENADLLFTQGKEPLEYARSMGRKNPVYLPNVVQPSWFDDFDGKIIDNNEKFVFLFIGRILKSKGIFNLIPVFNSLAKKYPKIELWIVGPSNGFYTDLLKQAVNGFEDKIKILGPKNHDEVTRHIMSCDVVVDPFTYASFSTVALEALYCKKPIIAPLLGDTKDVVKEGITGYLVDSRKPEQLMAKMEQCITNYAEALELAKNGHEVVKKFFTCDKTAEIIDANFCFYGDREKLDVINKNYENLRD